MPVLQQCTAALLQAVVVQASDVETQLAQFPDTFLDGLQLGQGLRGFLFVKLVFSRMVDRTNICCRWSFNSCSTSVDNCAAVTELR